MNATPTLLQGRYHLCQIIKFGSMGKVHLAIDKRLNCQVAIKEASFSPKLDENWLSLLRNAFKKEAELLATLKHPAIPKAYDYFVENDTQYIVMELIKGADLDDVINRQKTPFKYEQVAGWIEQLIDVLEYHHRQNPAIIHRDIKPSNIKITNQGKICLLDFGIAKEIVEEILTSERSLKIATFEFAPLEQIIKASPQKRDALMVINKQKTLKYLAKPTSPQSDIFALGATLYRMLTKQLPVDSFARSLAVWSQKPDPILPISFLNQTIPTKVAASIMDALALAPSKRPQSIKDFRQNLVWGVPQRHSVINPSCYTEKATHAPTPPNIDFLSILIKQKQMLEKKVKVLEENLLQANHIISEDLRYKNSFLNPRPQSPIEPSLRSPVQKTSQKYT